MTRKLTDLDKQIINIAVMNPLQFLQLIGRKDWDIHIIEIAVLNPSQFIQLFGEKEWLSAKICFLRMNGYSYGKIVQKLDVTIDAARWNCKKCESKSQ